jgi:hypothetical protein
VDRARATAIGLEAIKKSFSVDASGYELEVVERAFPAGKTELTWRSPATKYGHVEQLRVNLQGDRLILIERSYQQPRDYKEPTTPLGMRVFKFAGPGLVGATAIVGWGFGLYFLFKIKNWDALTRRMPLAMCALVILQVGLSSFGSQGAFQSLMGRAPTPVLLVGVVLPALSGVLLWITRQSPVRMWAADQLTRGRVLPLPVAASLIDGVAAGMAIAGISVLTDWIALSVAGFEPSISRELNIVDAGLGSMIGNTFSGAAFVVLGIALVVEAFDRFRVNPIVSTLVVAIGGGLVAGSNQDAILAALPLVAGMSLSGVIVVMLYRRRGFLAAWVGAVIAGLLTDSMALRSLEDADLLWRSTVLITIVVVIGAAGAWGAGRRLFQKPTTLHPGA